MKQMLLTAALLALLHLPSQSQPINDRADFNSEGFTLATSSPVHAEINYAIGEWSLKDLTIDRKIMQKIDLPRHFLPNDEGKPDLPGSGRYIAIPQGATARLNILSFETETLRGIEIAPAPRIPKTTENGPLQYRMDADIYSSDAFYPSTPVQLSNPLQIRGVDVVMLGITPFQYNPVSKELVIYKNIQAEVIFEGGNGVFGDNRLRSRWWDPLVKDAVMNREQLPAISAESRRIAARGTGCEYLIICPDDPVFTAWADTIRLFRNRQGILTDVVTTTEIGGNNVNTIESFINNAYNTWDIPPAAILVLGDYGTSGSTVVAPIWDNYCASDNIYADVNNDDLPDIVLARMTAQNGTHLETMIRKFIDYETNPYTDPEYYHHPITALGWQTERWFQVCIEVVGGFFRNSLGKDPVRINEVYDGNPAVDPWSTAPNTNTIMNYFGPNGLGYIPSSPSALGDWSGGNASDINNAINQGSFILLHRDHGYEQGWGEPAYSNGNLSGLSNDKLTFVYSVNCLTGKYNWGSECFTEAFHRQPQRALGLIAASEVSYSFVNDTYVWGAFDNMWPEFMPDYGTTPASRGLLPAFSNAAGKIYLEQSGWPYNTGNKEVTYNLFHHHGDAFTTLYSEVPQNLLVIHDGVMTGGSDVYTVQADTLSLIALSVNGEIIRVAEGTGAPVDIMIEPQIPGTEVAIVVTKTNYFRYENSILVISPNAPYVLYQAHELNDEDGNSNGQMDYAESLKLTLTLQNIGAVDATNVDVTISTEDPFVTITDAQENAGNINGNQSVSLTDGFAVTVSDTIPDGHTVSFLVEATDGNETWHSDFFVIGHAPVLEHISFLIDDQGGNDNGKLDPGETADFHLIIANTGSSEAFNVVTSLSVSDMDLTVISGPQSSGNLTPQSETEVVFTVSASEYTPGGLNATFDVDIAADFSRNGSGSFTTVVGRYTALVLDLDPNSYSAPGIMETFQDMDLMAAYTNQFPADFTDYKSVFLCLGIYYSNHVLTDAEAQMLKTYLENEGRLYMEGRTTWYDDPQTVLHEMFGINTEFTNWYQYDSLHGIPGTFTEGMTFAFDGEDPYNKYKLIAVDPAYEIMRSMNDSRGAMVAYDAATYKTIGSNFEFGGLIDGETPSTKETLMYRILGFFGDILTETEESTGYHPDVISAYPNPFENRITFTTYLDEKTEMTLELIDITGRVLLHFREGMLDKGTHSFTMEVPGQSKAPGIYFYRFKTSKGVFSGKLLRIN